MNSTMNQNQKQVKNIDETKSKLENNSTRPQPKEEELYSNLEQLTKTLNSINRNLIDTFGYQGDIVGPDGLIQYNKHNHQYEILPAALA